MKELKKQKSLLKTDPLKTDLLDLAMRVERLKPLEGFIVYRRHIKDLLRLTFAGPGFTARFEESNTLEEEKKEIIRKCRRWLDREINRMKNKPQA